MKLAIGDHQFREFQDLDAAFGANRADYPDYDKIPDEYKSMNHPMHIVASGLFFEGGPLGKFDIRFKRGTSNEDAGVVITALRALLSSWDPKHEVKMSTVAWLLDTYMEKIE